MDQYIYIDLFQDDFPGAWDDFSKRVLFEATVSRPAVNNGDGVFNTVVHDQFSKAIKLVWTLWAKNGFPLLDRQFTPGHLIKTPLNEATTQIAFRERSPSPDSRIKFFEIKNF